MKTFITLACVALFLSSVAGDLYMQNPRGANNKLNDENQNTQNENRLYDSQNNAKGGYMWGPKMYFYAGSILSMEYTHQHSCGMGNNDCEMVFQYMCDDTLRDGDPEQGANGRATYDPNQADQGATNGIRGRHETAEWYNDCKARQRNKGLFFADQNPDENIGATSTRQNSGGTRYGTECPEERDYYPYWHPTPWKDIMIAATNTSRCDYYVEESGNTKEKGICSNPQHNNEDDCDGTWEESSHDLDPVECVATHYSRDNHNGNGVRGYQNAHNWTIPNEPHENCVLRFRYNISTYDFDGWNTFAESNGGNSPVVNDPAVDIGVGAKLQLALNTAQYFRTFEDRSHTFEIRAKDGEIPSGCEEIWNLNVRGRRGNIEQTYPATEYDFVPQRLHLKEGGCAHIQWTGSDYNAANQAGEGTDQTDRHNMVQVKKNSLGANYPEDKADMTMFTDSDLIDGLALLGGQNGQLNDAPAYYDAGVQQWDDPATYHYMCTRNNNFTNRGQKATLIIGNELSGALALAIGIGIALILLSATVGGAALYAKKNPQSQVAALFNRRGSMGSRSSGSRSYGNGSYGSRGSKGSKYTQHSGYTRN